MIGHIMTPERCKPCGYHVLAQKKESDWEVTLYAREHVAILLSLPFKDAATD